MSKYHSGKLLNSHEKHMRLMNYYELPVTLPSIQSTKYNILSNFLLKTSALFTKLKNSFTDFFSQQLKSTAFPCLKIHQQNLRQLL